MILILQLNYFSIFVSKNCLMKNLAILLFLLLPIISLADPEYSLVLRYLRDIPSHTTDQEAIEGLKKMNVSDEAKKDVHVEVVTQMKRYELAWYMTENGYIKLSTIGQMFSKPFSDDINVPNKKQMSSRIYSDSELLDYAKKFIATGTEVTPGDVQAIKAKGTYPQLSEYLNGLLSADQVDELNVNTLRQMLVKRPVNFEEVKLLITSTNTPAPADALTFARIETVELTQFLLDHGADLNADHVLVNGINMGNIEVVQFLLDKGANPCRNATTKIDPLENAERFMKNAKSKERQEKLKEIIKIVKVANKNCAQ